MAEVAEEFAASLNDLTVNSKPHINMLTMLADDNHEFATHITETVLNHLQKVPPEIKLPVLYLIDSIVKNVGKAYIPLFTQAIVQQFAYTFEKVDEKTREQMFKLRQTWNDVFPAKIMFALDSKVQKIDPAWPCTASPPSNVHVNPKFFKPDILGSKSLAATLKDADSHRSRHRKHKNTSRSLTHSSSHSKKTSQVSSTPVDGVSKASQPTSESLREQLIMKQKMLLELQQQKLKLELLQTQAQLEEQQKQLERQSLNHKTSSESATNALKLQQMVNQEEAKYKSMAKNLKRHMQMKFPKLHQIHRVTTEMKAQAQKADMTKGTVPEGLLKPAALLELNEEVHVKPPKPPVPVKPAPAPKEPKPRIVQFQQPEKQKAVVLPDSTEDAPPPVRIAPVSSQLIIAAMGRNVRDPRLRQRMSSRQETQPNSTTSAQVTVSTPSFTAPPAPALTSSTSSLVKKPEASEDTKSYSKLKKEKRSNSSHQQKEKLSKSSEDESKLSKSPNRTSDKSPRKSSGRGERSPSKKLEDKSDKRARVDDLFASRSKSPSHIKPTSNSQSPSKSHTKRDQVSLSSSSVEIPQKTNFMAKAFDEEPNAKKARLQEDRQDSVTLLTDKAIPVSQTPKLILDVKAAQSIKQPDSNQARLSPESLDSSADMLDEDIEKIVKNASKTTRFAQKVTFQIDRSQKSPKSSDDSPEDRFDDIIRNPTKQIKLHEINKSIDSSTNISKLLDPTKQMKLLEINKSIEDNVKVSKPFDPTKQVKTEEIIQPNEDSRQISKPFDGAKQIEVQEINKFNDKSKNMSPFEAHIHNIIRHQELKSSAKSEISSGSLQTTRSPDMICKPAFVDVRNSELQISDMQQTNTKTQSVHYNEAQESEQTKKSVSQIIQQNLVQTSPIFTNKDPRLHSQTQEGKHESESAIPKPEPKLFFTEVPKEKFEEALYDVKDNTLYNVTQPEEDSSKLDPFIENQNDINESFIKEEVVTTEIPEPKQEDHITSEVDDVRSCNAAFEILTESLIPLPPPLVPTQETEFGTNEGSVFSSEKLTVSPKNVPSLVGDVVPMEVTQKTDAVSPAMELSLPTKTEKRRASPDPEKKPRKGEKPSIMEQLIADAEKHEASPSPPPPPVISDKFKEIKQSSLSRLRRVGRLRDDLGDSESPEPADVDLRPQIQPPALIKDLKNEVLGLADKDVDLRNLSASPTKKRPSMEKLLDAPPTKKSKAEVMDELFGSEDVDLRPVLCPPLPSPPPPPIISNSPPPESAGEKGWARYKETKPDTYKVKYTPSRRDRAPSTDRFSSRNSRNSLDGAWQGRTRTSSYQKDVDMRPQPPGIIDGSYNHIIMQAYEQLQRGDLTAEAYKRVLSEVCAMREKQQLEEAQRREEEEAAQVEPLDSISEDDISGGSLSGVEDAPSPTDSYTGGEDVEEPSLDKSTADDMICCQSNNEIDKKAPERHRDVDIRLPPTDVDIRLSLVPRIEVDIKAHVDDKPSRKNRSSSPFSRRHKDVDKDRNRTYKEEMRAQKREKRARRSDEDKGLPYRSSRYGEDNWDHQERVMSPSEARMDVEPPRVPPIPNYRESLLPSRDSPPMCPPVPWDTQRMSAPPTPWLPGMAPPTVRGPPPLMGMRPPIPHDRFMPPRWRQHGPSPMFDGEPSGPRFSRFGPMGRFPVPFAPYDVPPTDPNVLKLIEEDPTKSISIDGVPRDIRFYGPKAVALMNWDDPREVSFQNGSRRIILDDRDSLIVHFNSPPSDMIIDGKTHRVWFGAPTRELYIDNQWHEVFFGGPPVTCEIGGKPHQVQLEGPPPNVRPGIQRKDLVVGKISLIIDAKYIFSIYLDAKPQKFEVGGVAYIIRFVEALQKTVINGVAFKSDFGGLPQPIILNGNKHFFRLTALPRGVTPGFLTIVNMEGGRMPSPTALPAPPQLPASLEQVVEFNSETKLAEPFLKLPTMPLITPPHSLSPEVPKREMEPVVPLHPPLNVPPPPITSLPSTSVPPPTTAVHTLDMLTTLMPTPEPGQAVDYSYSVDSENSNHTAALTTTSATSTTTTAPTLTGDINVTELLQKLMATGMVPKLDQPKDKDQDKPVTAETGLIRPVDFLKPETLKIRQSALVSHLYSGIQCNSCGVRFPPEQTMKYSQHLDWHFRQNRRDKDSTRTAQTRRYYYDVNDWVQFEEIEDLEERAQPWFDMQESANTTGAAEEAPPAVLVSVKSADYPEEAACHICLDKFESFYNEEKEEWQLRNAVDTDGKLAHPLCIEDQRAAAEKPIVLDDIDITEDESKEEEVKESKETEVPRKLEEDDDIMEVTDIEFIKPVFPVEDLTVSDSESVADNNEDKSELLEDSIKENEEESTPDVQTEEFPENEEKSDEAQEESKDEEEKALEDTVNGESVKVVEDLSKDENTQDDLLLVEKGEDSVLSTSEIMEVVRNIKKDPDALGGEYEEVNDPDVKKEKGEIPLPAPVVDTTHATVTCLIDGNVEFEETPQQLNVGGPPKIKINITKPNIQSTSKEPKESAVAVEVEVEEPESSILAAEKQLSLVTQPPPPGEEPIPIFVKEKLKGKKIQDLPCVVKGSEMSGLCSIM